jgi:hypothetical protein
VAVYSEEAVLPYAVVEYGFAQVARSDDVYAMLCPGV